MDAERFAPTPEPPYYAVIFASQQTGNPAGYDAMGDAMVNLATTQPGFLGIESTRDETGFGITVSYWTSEEIGRRKKRSHNGSKWPPTGSRKSVDMPNGMSISNSASPAWSVPIPRPTA